MPDAWPIGGARVLDEPSIVRCDIVNSAIGAGEPASAPPWRYCRNPARNMGFKSRLSPRGDDDMADAQGLQPAAALLRKSTASQPHESPEYRKARDALLVEEIELRRHVARVAALRRALPPGGEVKGDYQFIGEAS